MCGGEMQIVSETLPQNCPPHSACSFIGIDHQEGSFKTRVWIFSKCKRFIIWAVFHPLIFFIFFFISCFGNFVSNFRSSLLSCVDIWLHLVYDGMNLFVKRAFRSIRTVLYTTHMLKASVCEPQAGSACTWGGLQSLPPAVSCPHFMSLLLHTAGITPPLLCIPRDSHSSLPEIWQLHVARQIKWWKVGSCVAMQQKSTQLA